MGEESEKEEKTGKVFRKRRKRKCKFNGVCFSLCLLAK